MTTPIPPETVAELRTLLARATGAPWVAVDAPDGGRQVRRKIGNIPSVVIAEVQYHGDNADLIVALRNNAEALLALASQATPAGAGDANAPFIDGWFTQEHERRRANAPTLPSAFPSAPTLKTTDSNPAVSAQEPATTCGPDKGNQKSGVTAGETAPSPSVREDEPDDWVTIPQKDFAAESDNYLRGFEAGALARATPSPAQPDRDAELEAEFTMSEEIEFPLGMADVRQALARGAELVQVACKSIADLESRIERLKEAFERGLPHAMEAMRYADEASNQPDSFREGIEEAARRAERRIRKYNPDVSAIDVRMSSVEVLEWQDGPTIAEAIRALLDGSGS